MKQGNILSEATTPTKEAVRTELSPTSPSRNPFRRIASWIQVKRSPSAISMASNPRASAARVEFDRYKANLNDNESSHSGNSDAFYANMDSSMHIGRQTLVGSQVFPGDRGSEDVSTESRA
ncbi:hypothetical protein LTR70_005056 [Exophiala xenobiotica]|uniref:Uncharacterized protein n=1 Tax=Lithohypha guttulata TaxID=1690604 RepID=A0ABR0K8V2_9EURO|nr:hypothetical protein LTR24_005532 [Lithohypha guttulata]KAK5319303.1 hypothetical protein LTR70_005056 [Exophiala xenobiotica]